eukprot:642261-Rhodomonas_salina.5
MATRDTAPDEEKEVVEQKRPNLVCARKWSDRVRISQVIPTRGERSTSALNHTPKTPKTPKSRPETHQIAAIANRVGISQHFSGLRVGRAHRGLDPAVPHHLLPPNDSPSHRLARAPDRSQEQIHSGGVVAPESSSDAG